MKSAIQMLLLAACLHSIRIAQGQIDKYTNENRPYKFGFKIGGEQHRQEQKDENGIIMGEFGYLTADGIYHLTVFATDKDGNYKILQMKNTRVGPSPWGARTAAPPTTTTTTTTTTTPEPPTDEFILSGKPGCSGCFVPTPPPPGAPPAKPLKVPNLGVRFPLAGRPNTGGTPGTPGSPGGSPGGIPSGPSGGRPGSTIGIPGSSGGRPFGAPGTPGGTPGGSPGGIPSGPSGGRPFGAPGTQGQAGRPPGSTGLTSGLPSGGKPFPPRGQFAEKPDPAFGTGQPSPLNPNTFPNAQQVYNNGPPPGVTEEDVLGLLYKFNYTVGFHGHHETGNRKGDKEGEYYVHYRDGTARKVTYIADEMGFKPRVTLVKIDNPEDIPKAETEKEYGLKGYEFKWFSRR